MQYSGKSPRIPKNAFHIFEEHHLKMASLPTSQNFYNVLLVCLRF